jgi:hypothetical protein
MDKLNNKELNYILRDIPNKLNLSTIFKKRKLFAFGSGNTHLSEPTTEYGKNWNTNHRCE